MDGQTPNPAGTPAPNGQPPAPQGEQAADETPASFDAYLETQPEPIKALYTSHTAGLKSALENERKANREHERQIRELAGKADKGSEAQQQLNALADQLASANRAADFYKEAARPELGLADAEAAWLIVNAKADDFIDKRGNVNFTLLKERHPGLFARTTPPPAPRGNAGSGVGGNTPSQNMNDYIRRAAGLG